MNQASNILQQVRRAAQERILFLSHALDRMSVPDRMIAPGEVRDVIFHGEIVEDYPEDVRGHSCLMLGWGEGGRPIHVICAPKDEYLAIISVYLPDPDRWEADWKTRKEK